MKIHFLSFLLFYINIGLVFSIIAYDCFNDQSNFTSISLTKVEECEDPNENKITTEEKEIQVIQEKQWSNYHIYHCKITVTKLITYCGLHSHASVTQQGFQDYIHYTSYSDCMGIHEHNEISIDNHLISQIPLNSTSDYYITLRGNIDVDNNCYGETYSTPSTTYKNVVVQSSISISVKDYETLFEIKHNDLIFNDGSTCSLENKVCIHPIYGYTYWNEGTYQKCDEYSRDVIYQGSSLFSYEDKEVGMGTVVTVHQDSSLFSLTIKSASHVCHQRAYSTDHDRIYIIVKSSYGYFFKKVSILSQNIDLTMYMNSKISYTTKLTNSLIKKVYIDLSRRDCEIERMTIINKLAIVRQHPLSFGHIITGEQGYYSVVNGEVAHMMRCQPVEVSLRRTSICSSNLPITYMNTSMFMEPVARIITNTSQEVPCSPASPSMYEISGKWYTFIPGAVKAQPPTIISPKKSSTNIQFDNIKNLITSGLYPDNAMDKFKSFMSFPLTRLDTNNYVSAKISGLNLYNDNVYSPDHLISDNIWSIKIKRTLVDSFGGFMSFGSVVGGFMGIFVIYKIGIKLLSIIINILHLNKVLGCGFHLLASLLDSATHFVLSSSRNDDDDHGICKLSSGKDLSGSKDHQINIQMDAVTLANNVDNIGNANYLRLSSQGGQDIYN